MIRRSRRAPLRPRGSRLAPSPVCVHSRREWDSGPERFRDAGVPLREERGRAAARQADEGVDAAALRGPIQSID